ncbi:MAG: hypothetical protein ACLGRW_20740 [Acidobacteriota bacterium]
MSEKMITCLWFDHEVEGGTLITFRHTVLGFVPSDQKAAMNKGWDLIHDRVRKQADSSRN